MASLLMTLSVLLIVIKQGSLSRSVVIQSEIGSRDNFTILNSTCRMSSGLGICDSFGAQEDGQNCSCICPQANRTFGYDGNSCKCLPNSILYGGCSKASYVDKRVLQPGYAIPLSLPSKNCSLILLYKSYNGPWKKVNNSDLEISLKFVKENNGSLQVINSTKHLHGYGTLFNVIIDCLNYNSTCLLLKLSGKLTCPLTGLIKSTLAPTTSMNNVTTPSKTNSNAIGKKEIIIIASGCLAFVALIFLVLFVWICCRKRSRRIKKNRKESQQQMTADQDVDRRSSEAVIFARPVAMVPQRKDTANPSFETEDDTNSSEADDYDMPIVEDHSIINDLINKIRRPKSVQNQTPTDSEIEEKSDIDTDYYQVMDSLGKPDNIENAVVYENTKGLIDGGTVEEAKQPSNKKKRSETYNNLKSRILDKRNKDGKKKNGKVPEVTVSVEEIPENENNTDQENFYENNQMIKELQASDSPPRTPLPRINFSHANDVPEEEEGPPPPLRSSSLENGLDKLSSTPIPSPRPRAKPQGSETKEGLNSEVDKEVENDSSGLYENFFPTPLPRGKR